jgi:hypothetical protein
MFEAPYRPTAAAFERILKVLPVTVADRRATSGTEVDAVDSVAVRRGVERVVAVVISWDPLTATVSTFAQQPAEFVQTGDAGIIPHA